MSDAFDLDDLKYLMARLRDPDTGCPWDLEQDFASIVPHTLEEAAEVADAIERADYPHLKDELGDLLFQVVFYAQLGREKGYFDLDQVVDNLVGKLLRRHPHVFPAGTLESERPAGTRPSRAEIKANWERIKADERRAKPKQDEDPSVMADIPATLPATARAEKLQRRAATLGFDWDAVDPIFDKLDEEKAEIREALRNGNRDEIEDEVGDLFFVCVNLARYMNVNPEKALRRANRKFERRFRLMEQALGERGGDFASCNVERLEALWQEAKQRLMDADELGKSPNESL